MSRTKITCWKIIITLQIACAVCAICKPLSLCCSPSNLNVFLKPKKHNNSLTLLGEKKARSPKSSCYLKTVLSVGQQGPEFNGYLVGRGNSREIDLNRNFPDLNALMYYYEKTNGRNHHLPLPDNWEQQVSAAG